MTLLVTVEETPKLPAKITYSNLYISRAKINLKIIEYKA